MRMCANVPAQHAIQTALGGYQSIEELIVPGGRFYEQSMLADRLLNEIPGVTSVKPRGALYCFPRLDPAVYAIEDDESSSSTCCAPRRSWSPTAPASTGPSPTTSGWSRCPTSPCSRRRSAGSPTSSPPAADAA